MIIDITNELLTNIKTALDGIADVGTSYNEEVNTFPYVTFVELTNDSNDATFDTGGEKHNNMSFEIEIFANGSSRMTTAKEIRNTVDGVLTPKGLKRTFSQTVPNFLDNKIYRYVLRYSCVVDESKQVYRR